MGTGKTTVGRAVAQRLGFDCIDSDHEIERQTGKTIPQIFAEDGEPAFRAREREFVLSGHPAQRTVVACGGGLVVQPGLAEELRNRGVVVCLHASLATVLERAARHTNRPLLHVPDPEQRVRELFAGAGADLPAGRHLGPDRFPAVARSGRPRGAHLAPGGAGFCPDALRSGARPEVRRHQTPRSAAPRPKPAAGSADARGR